MIAQATAITIGLAGVGALAYRDYRAGEGFGWLVGSLVTFALYMGVALGS
jgi:hypothetical protein